MTYYVAMRRYTPATGNEEGNMEAIMIAGIAVVAVGGWYSVLDLLADSGLRFEKRNRVDGKTGSFSCHGTIPLQRRVKQMAGMNI